MCRGVTVLSAVVIPFLVGALAVSFWSWMRTHRELLKREPAMPAESSRLFVPSGNPKRLVRVTTPMRWFEIVAAFREEWNIEYGDLSDGPMYGDECVEWLQQQLDLDLYEIVITEET